MMTWLPKFLTDFSPEDGNRLGFRNVGIHVIIDPVEDPNSLSKLRYIHRVYFGSGFWSILTIFQRLHEATLPVNGPHPANSAFIFSKFRVGILAGKVEVLRLMFKLWHVRDGRRGEAVRWDFGEARCVYRPLCAWVGVVSDGKFEL